MFMNVTLCKVSCDISNQIHQRGLIDFFMQEHHSLLCYDESVGNQSQWSWPWPIVLAIIQCMYVRSCWGEDLGVGGIEWAWRGLQEGHSLMCCCYYYLSASASLSSVYCYVSHSMNTVSTARAGFKCTQGQLAQQQFNGLLVSYPDCLHEISLLVDFSVSFDLSVLAFQDMYSQQLCSLILDPTYLQQIL